MSTWRARDQEHAFGWGSLCRAAEGNYAVRATVRHAKQRRLVVVHIFVRVWNAPAAESIRNCKLASHLISGTVMTLCSQIVRSKRIVSVYEVTWISPERQGIQILDKALFLSCGSCNGRSHAQRSAACKTWALLLCLLNDVGGLLSSWRAAPGKERLCCWRFPIVTQKMRTERFLCPIFRFVTGTGVKPKLLVTCLWHRTRRTWKALSAGSNESFNCASALFFPTCRIQRRYALSRFLFWLEADFSPNFMVFTKLFGSKDLHSWSGVVTDKHCCPGTFTHVSAW